MTHEPSSDMNDMTTMERLDLAIRRLDEAYEALAERVEVLEAHRPGDDDD